MNKTKRIILILGGAILVGGAILFLYGFVVIYRDVKANCLKAQNEYKEDCVDSLIALVKDEDKTLRERNSAVWVLGQLADKKALPLLYELEQSLSEQERCDHDKYLCKYEVKKAIKWCEDGNITNWMYKGRAGWR